MSAATLEFSESPSALLGYVRAAVARKRGLRDGATIPRIEARLRSVRPDAARVAKYRRLCAFKDDGNLPATFPHVLAAPLHLAVLTHKDFPLKLIGAVHVRNEVTQHRTLDADEVFDVETWVEGHEDVEAGIEFTLHTRLRDLSGNVPWESRSTNLVRRGGGAKKAAAPWTPPSFDGWDHRTSWKAPSDIGRKYGPLASDVNPIHIHPLLAKPLGFPRAIAHGMWSFARAVGETSDAVPQGALKLAVQFKRPLLLPGEAHLYTRALPDGLEYRLTNASRETIYTTGEVRKG